MLCDRIVEEVTEVKIKSYRELSRLKTFKERFDYLKLSGVVGASTFGYDRYLNQKLYTSQRWQHTRDQVIIRDGGCDLGIEGYELNDRIIVHHINPITAEDIENDESIIFDLNNLISTSHNTHNAIHFSDESLIPKGPIERKRNDTCPWL